MANRIEPRKPIEPIRLPPSKEFTIVQGFKDKFPDMPLSTFLTAAPDPDQPGTAWLVRVDGTFSRTNLNNLGLVEGKDYEKKEVMIGGIATFAIKTEALKKALGIEFHRNAPERS